MKYGRLLTLLFLFSLDVSSAKQSKTTKTITFDSAKYKTVKNKQRTIEFKCDKRQYCSQMRSYDEALFFIRNCPNAKMDGDKDGIPCERQFNKR